MEDLLAHVDEELLANEQKEKEEMQKRDEAMALALDEIYQTQDVVSIEDSEALSRVRSKARLDRVVSLDTPTRKISHLSLDSPSSTSRVRDQEHQREANYVISDQSVVVGDEKATSNNRVLQHDLIELSDMESSSSQNGFYIQPGQVIPESDSLSTSDSYISTRPISRKKGVTARKPSKAKEESKSVDVPSPYEINDEVLDDDLNDFLDKPAPASMLNRPFRTRSKGAGGKTGVKVSPKRTSATKKSGKGMVNLDDSEGENEKVVERRQQIVNRNRRQRDANEVDIDDEIEIGRHQPVTEKLWNQEDDLLDSEQLDRRLVKGVGVWGVVGGIGAVPGSLTMSKFTRTTAAEPRSETAAVIASSTAITMVNADGNKSAPPSKSLGQGSSGDDGFFVRSPSFEYEDPNYGMHSQEWWDAAQPGNYERSKEHDESPVDGHVGGASTTGDNDGYTSLLDDFVDLRKRLAQLLEAVVEVEVEVEVADVRVHAEEESQVL
ncbi:hypothetical protein BGZ65_009557, partial [Modicella reniformis]